MQSFAEGGPSTEAAQKKARGYGLDGSETDFYREDFHRIRAKVLMRDDFYLVPVIRHYQTAGGVIYAGLPSRDDKAFIVAPNNLRSHHAFTRRYFWVSRRASSCRCIAARHGRQQKQARCYQSPAHTATSCLAVCTATGTRHISRPCHIAGLGAQVAK